MLYRQNEVVSYYGKNYLVEASFVGGDKVDKLIILVDGVPRTVNSREVSLVFKSSQIINLLKREGILDA